MIATTATRVSQNTAEEINERIRQETEANIRRISQEGPTSVERRLKELDQEWDIERLLETVAPSLTLLGLTLGLTVNKKWFIVPVLVQSFFLQHALQGWCPPLPVLRSLGVRTQGEIDRERYALKAIRGDFRRQSGSSHTDRILEAIQD
jgi:hypothetical protein